jgi:hypothetical protein
MSWLRRKERIEDRPNQFLWAPGNISTVAGNVLSGKGIGSRLANDPDVVPSKARKAGATRATGCSPSSPEQRT